MMQTALVALVTASVLPIPDIRFAESTVALAYPKRVGWLLDEAGRATRGVVA